MFPETTIFFFTPELTDRRPIKLLPLLNLFIKLSAQPDLCSAPSCYSLLICCQLVTLSRPPTSSSLRIINRSFRYAAPHLWNQLTLTSCQIYAVAFLLKGWWLESGQGLCGWARIPVDTVKGIILYSIAWTARGL